jgi:hypothetical protein
MITFSFQLSLSGRRGSNPRPSAWKADALPTELLPPKIVGVIGFEPIQPKATDLQSAPSLQLRRTPIQPKFGAGRGIRTHDPEITNHVLWPTELCRHK